MPTVVQSKADLRAQRLAAEPPKHTVGGWNEMELPESGERFERYLIKTMHQLGPISITHEVATIIPQCAVPVQPLLVQGDVIHEYPMFRDLRKYPWVLPTARYEDTPGLLAALKAQVLEPAEQKAKELARLKAED